MYCKNCGNKINDNVVMCPYCKTFISNPLDSNACKKDDEPEILLNDSGLQTQRFTTIVLCSIFGALIIIPAIVFFVLMIVAACI